MYSLALRLRNTKEPVWTHESIGYLSVPECSRRSPPVNSLALRLRNTKVPECSRRSPPVYSLALRLRNTKVPVWTHESIRYPKMDISHWDAAIHYILIQPYLVTLFHEDYPLCAPLP